MSVIRPTADGATSLSDARLFERIAEWIPLERVALERFAGLTDRVEICAVLALLDAGDTLHEAVLAVEHQRRTAQKAAVLAALPPAEIPEAPTLGGTLDEAPEPPMPPPDPFPEVPGVPGPPPLKVPSRRSPKQADKAGGEG